jgi:cold-inducible RNA-binding protein
LWPAEKEIGSRFQAAKGGNDSRSLFLRAEESVVMGRKLYVGNLPYQTGEAELTELFSRAGTVESARIMRDMATGRARGFGFVEMATDEEAQRAITELNEFKMEGRALVVNEARPKPMGGGGGGGGFGGDRGGRGGGGGNRREPRW